MSSFHLKQSATATLTGTPQLASRVPRTEPIAAAAAASANPSEHVPTTQAAAAAAGASASTPTAASKSGANDPLPVGLGAPRGPRFRHTSRSPNGMSLSPQPAHGNGGAAAAGGDRVRQDERKEDEAPPPSHEDLVQAAFRKLNESLGRSMPKMMMIPTDDCACYSLAHEWSCIGLTGCRCSSLRLAVCRAGCNCSGVCDNSGPVMADVYRGIRSGRFVLDRQLPEKAMTADEDGASPAAAAEADVPSRHTKVRRSTRGTAIPPSPAPDVLGSKRRRSAKANQADAAVASHRREDASGITTAQDALLRGNGASYEENRMAEMDDSPLVSESPSPLAKRTKIVHPPGAEAAAAADGKKDFKLNASSMAPSSSSAYGPAAHRLEPTAAVAAASSSPLLGRAPPASNRPSEPSGSPAAAAGAARGGASLVAGPLGFQLPLTCFSPPTLAAASSSYRHEQDPLQRIWQLEEQALEREYQLTVLRAREESMRKELQARDVMEDGRLAMRIQREEIARASEHAHVLADDTTGTPN